MDDDDFHPPHDNVVIYDSWRLGCDCTVTKSKKRHENFKGPYSWTGCELTSPVLGAHDYAAKIEDVCRILKTVRVHLNGSTAVHVHVGRGNEPFRFVLWRHLLSCLRSLSRDLTNSGSERSLPTVKKFATLYWLTEKAIMELHHPSRSDNRHCLPLTQHSVLAARSRAALVDKHREPYDEGLTHLEDYLPKGGLTGPQRAQVRRIWSCGSIEEVAELMWIREDIDSDTPAPPKRGSVGFYRFLPAGKTGGNIQTFEWRQMFGSTDASHINQWIKACIAFTDFCRLSDQTTFKAFVGSIIAKGENYTGIELLEALDVDTQIFRRMQGVWARNRHFYNDSRGRNLFLLDKA